MAAFSWLLFHERRWMTVRSMVFGVFFAFWSLIAGLWLLLQTWHGWSALMIFSGGILVAYSLTFFYSFSSIGDAPNKYAFLSEQQRSFLLDNSANKW